MECGGGIEQLLAYCPNDPRRPRSTAVDAVRDTNGREQVIDGAGGEQGEPVVQSGSRSRSRLSECVVELDRFKKTQSKLRELGEFG